MKDDQYIYDGEVAIMSVKSYKLYVKLARAVYVTVDYGTSSHVVKISKKDALKFVKGMSNSAEPEDYKIAGDMYGLYDEDTEFLYLG